jgi:arsenate reductase
MAEGWLKSMKPGLTVQSAGTNPEGLSSGAVKAMLEIGQDISDQTSKHLDDVSWNEVDYAITLCGSANETCVTMNWPEKCVREHWPIADPVSNDEYIKARDEIGNRIKDFVNRMI